MQLMKRKLAIDFMRKRRFAMVLSVILVTVSIAALVSKGLNFGIDFTGGTLIEAGYPEAVELEGIRAALEAGDFGNAQVQHFGSSRDVLIRIAPQSGKNSVELSEQALNVLREQNSMLEMRRVEFVGPQVGEELTEQGALAMIYALIGILIYIMGDFSGALHRARWWRWYMT